MKRVLKVLALALALSFCVSSLASAKNIYLLTKMTTVDDWRKSTDVCTYKYNEKGLLTKKTEKASLGGKSVEKFYYKNDRIYKSTYNNDVLGSKSTITYTYKKDGTLYKETRKNEDFSGAHIFNVKYDWTDPLNVVVRSWDEKKSKYVASEVIAFNELGSVKYGWWPYKKDPSYPRTFDSKGFVTSDYDSSEHRTWTNTFKSGRLVKTVLHYENTGIYPNRGVPVVTYTYKKVNVPAALVQRVTLQQRSLLGSGRMIPMC